MFHFNLFKEKLRNLSLKAKITGLFFSCILIIVIIFSSFQISAEIQQVQTEDWKNVYSHSQELGGAIDLQMTLYEEVFNLAALMTQIQELVDYVQENTTLRAQFNALNASQKIAGDFFIKQLNGLPIYQNLQSYFLNVSHSVSGIGLIRLFDETGNLLVGCKNNLPHPKDYKGDKSWFQDTLEEENTSKTLMSAISVSRELNYLSFRFSRPVAYSGESKAVFIIVYDARLITQILQNDAYMEGSFSAMVDPNYENAEGEFLGELYIANNIDGEDWFDETTAGDIGIEAEFLAENADLAENAAFYPDAQISLRGKNYLIRTYLLTIQGRSWYIFTGFDLEAIQQRYIGNILLQTGVNLGIMAAFLIGVFFFIKYAMKDLEALEHKTQQVAEGDYDVNFMTEEGFVTYYGTPLIAKGQVKGVLEVYHRQSLDPDTEWINYFETLAGQAAIAIDNSELFEGLQRANLELTLAYDTTLEGWVRALDLRDKETEGHTQRVANTTVTLARAMGIPESALIHVRRGALLHDIGKIGIPDAILHKPGPLTEAEWDIVRKHPIYAYELLSPITYLRPAVDIPYCHHEKWAGSGYPRQLKGEQIPLVARIFAIVDVWDALSYDRPYRKGWDKARVLEYILSQSNTHFDPKVVDKFVDMVNKNEI